MTRKIKVKQIFLNGGTAVEKSFHINFVLPWCCCQFLLLPLQLSEQTLKLAQAYIEELVMDSQSKLQILIDITTEVNFHGFQTMIRAMQTKYAAEFPARLQRHVRKLMAAKRCKISLKRLIVFYSNHLGTKTLFVTQFALRQACV